MDNATNMLVTDVARDVLEELAPQELPILPAAARAYFADPAAALKQSRSKDSALGFGADSFVFLTPVVLPVLSEIFEFLREVAEKSLEAGLAKEVPEIIKCMFRKFQPSEPGFPTLTTDQIAVVHGKVLAAAKRLRLPPHDARSLADAVTARLVMQR